jgi:hypothetical protein
VDADIEHFLFASGDICKISQGLGAKKYPAIDPVECRG